MSVYQYRYVAEGEGMRCDFCSNAYVKWEYPAQNFEMARGKTASAGSWMACDKCHSLVENEQWDLLAAHALHQFVTHGLPVGTTPALRSQMEKELRPQFRELYAAFQEHRDGEAKAVAPV